MKQSTLTWLGYSSFSAVVLISPAVQANQIPAVVTPNSPLYADYINPAPVSTTTAKRSGCSCQDLSSLDLTSLDLNDDAIGDFAIEQLGCDCAGCRNIVMQMAQAGAQLQP